LPRKKVVNGENKFFLAALKCNRGSLIPFFEKRFELSWRASARAAFLFQETVRGQTDDVDMDVRRHVF
jgi:hypothetical protein